MAQLSKVLKVVCWASRVPHSSGAVWELRWTSWAVRPNEPSGFRGHKELLNRASRRQLDIPSAILGHKYQNHSNRSKEWSQHLQQKWLIQSVNGWVDQLFYWHQHSGRVQGYSEIRSRSNVWKEHMHTEGHIYIKYMITLTFCCKFWVYLLYIYIYIYIVWFSCKQNGSHWDSWNCNYMLVKTKSR